MESTVMVGGQPVTVRSLNSEELSKLKRDYAYIIDEVRENDIIPNNAIAEIYKKRFKRVVRMAEMMVSYLNKNYEGIDSTGDGVAMDILTGDDFEKPYFVFNVSTVGKANIIDDGAGNPFKTNKFAAFQIFGLYNPTDDKKLTKVKVEKGGKNLPYISLDWSKYMVKEFPYNIEILPESSILMTGWFIDTGPSYIQPFGVKFVTIDKIRELSGTSPLKA